MIGGYQILSSSLSSDILTKIVQLIVAQRYNVVTDIEGSNVENYCNEISNIAKMAIIEGTIAGFRIVCPLTVVRSTYGEDIYTIAHTQCSGAFSLNNEVFILTINSRNSIYAPGEVKSVGVAINKIGSWSE